MHSPASSDSGSDGGDGGSNGSSGVEAGPGGSEGVTSSTGQLLPLPEVEDQGQAQVSYWDLHHNMDDRTKYSKGGVRTGMDRASVAAAAPLFALWHAVRGICRQGSRLSSLAADGPAKHCDPGLRAALEWVAQHLCDSVRLFSPACAHRCELQNPGDMGGC